jgi:hypothetical protein
MNLKSSAIALVSLMVIATPMSGQTSDSFDDQVGDYIRKYPYQRTYDYAVRYTGRDPGRLNTWVLPSEPALVRAGEDIVPRTNNDTYYQAATLWLEDGPVVLSATAPSRDRFNSFQLVDDRNANFRNVIYPSGEYTLYFGKKPETVHGEAIQVPSRLSVVLVRVEVKDKDDPKDVAAAKAVLKGMTIAGSQPARFPQLELLNGYPANVIAEANRRMDEAFVRIAFSRTIVGPGREPGRDVPYLYHAAGTKGGWGGADPSHSAFDAIFFDSNGHEMKGRNGTYTVTTAEPPVDAFWSITVYDTERGGFLHPNAANRHHSNNTQAVRNNDGSVTFTFKHACEAGDMNCLVVPAGRFDLVARYYLPRREIVSGQWTFPKVSLHADHTASETAAGDIEQPTCPHAEGCGEQREKNP